LKIRDHSSYKQGKWLRHTFQNSIFVCLFFLRGGGGGSPMTIKERGKLCIISCTLWKEHEGIEILMFVWYPASCRHISHCKSLESFNDWPPFYAIRTHGKYVVLICYNNYIINTWRRRKVWGCDSVNRSTATIVTTATRITSVQNIIFFLWPFDPIPGHGLPSRGFAITFYWTHGGWKDSSGRVISPTQRPLPDNTRHSKQINLRAPGGKWAAAKPRLRPRGHWDRQRTL